MSHSWLPTLLCGLHALTVVHLSLLLVTVCPFWIESLPLGSDQQTLHRSAPPSCRLCQQSSHAAYHTPYVWMTMSSDQHLLCEQLYDWSAGEGLGWLWPYLAGYPKKSIAVIDAACALRPCRPKTPWSDPKPKTLSELIKASSACCLWARSLGFGTLLLA